MSWVQMKYTVGVISACITEALTALWGGWGLWIEVLVIFMAMDIFVGLLAAFYNKELNSSIGHKGIIKKVLILCLVAVAFQLDRLMGTSVIRIAVIGFYTGIEGLSIVENAVKAGLNVPGVLRDALEQVKGEKGKVAD